MKLETPYGRPIRPAHGVYNAKLSISFRGNASGDALLLVMARDHYRDQVKTALVACYHFQQ